MPRTTKMRDDRDEKERFGDIASIVPPRSGAALRSVRENASAHGDGKDVTRCGGAKSRAEEPICAYAPKNSLLRRVSLYNWHTDYDYYENFRIFAQKTDDFAPRPSEHVPFFSYMPQYSQLDRAQFDFFIYFRSLVKNGEYPRVDYAYVLLLIYECINICRASDAQARLDILCGLWLAYREDYPRLDVQLSEWICDFCLINRLSPPRSLLSRAVPEIFSSASLKEFYVAPSDRTYVRLLIGLCSNYDYKKSKFAVGKNLAFYKKHTEGAISYVFERTSFSPTEKMRTIRTVRDSYIGALVSPRVKKRIEVEYYSLTGSYELRFFMADLLKYVENKIRSYLGVRPRLSHGELPCDVVRFADEYFALFLGRDDAPYEARYERAYDVPRKELSPDAAARIERASWRVTERLVAAFPERDGAESAPCGDFVAASENGGASLAPYAGGADGAESYGCDADACLALDNSAKTETGAPPSSDCGGLGEYHRRFLGALIDGDAEAARLAVCAGGKSAEILSDEINEYMLDLIGDIVVCDGADGFAVVGDYADDVAEMLKTGALK